MKTLITSLSDGTVEIIDVPVPELGDEQVLIRSKYSLISAGTERMIVGFGKSSWIKKAKSQPERLREVKNKVLTDGLGSTIDSINDKLQTPIPLGYCNVGVVEALGGNVTQLKLGQRVVSNSPHAEFTVASANLCRVIPDNVDDIDATFTVPAAIGLQAVRLAKAQIGELVCVIGLGLIGLLTAKILKANGCDVIGVDVNRTRQNEAKAEGITVSDPSAQDIKSSILSTRNSFESFDSVIVCAASSDNSPLKLAVEILRKKGRLILVGAVKCDLTRNALYEKEIEFVVSCSYGPGRYDEKYENGVDYPVSYVRWTAGRNFDAILRLLEIDALDLRGLKRQVHDFKDAPKVYNNLLSTANNGSANVVFDYGSHASHSRREPPEYEVKQISKNTTSSTSGALCGLIGSGDYARRFLAPLVSKAGWNLASISSKTGLSASLLGRKYGAKLITTDPRDIIDDVNLGTIFIATRHDTHADLVIECLKAGKNVYVEKPLALSMVELSNITQQLASCSTAAILWVGFNRRFAPMTVRLKTVNISSKPCMLNISINAGLLPQNHWTKSRTEGGGRIVGEVCHFIDLARFLTGSKIISSSVTKRSIRSDTCAISLTHQNGSVTSISYHDYGSKSYSKERIELHCNGKSAVLDNYKKLVVYDGGISIPFSSWFRQDKGQFECISAFKTAITEKRSGPLAEFLEASKIAIELQQQFDG